jgi:hypothetical protein
MKGGKGRINRNALFALQSTISRNVSDIATALARTLSPSRLGCFPKVVVAWSERPSQAMTRERIISEQQVSWKIPSDPHVAGAATFNAP